MMREVNESMNSYRDQDIAIIGIAGRFPEAENLELFWQNLSQGKDSVRVFPPGRVDELQKIAGEIHTDEFVQGGYLDSISYFDPEYFNISPEEVRYIDPQQRLLLELVDEAVNDAGYGGRLNGRKVGIYMAGSKNQYTNLIDPTMPMAIANIPDSALAGRIAYVFNFTGPVMTIDTACSSSLTAVHCACQAIRSGECDYAVAGGARMTIVPMGKGILQVLPILSKEERAKTFDRDADGTTFGEGGSVVLLKGLKQALADGDAIHAIIKASAVNSDGGRSNGLAAPNQDAQAEVIQDVLARAEVDADSISYIEAHGTGTRLGDPIEVEGIARAFGKHTKKKQFIAISSLKTNVGHLDTAAGVAGLTKVVLALRHKALPPLLHYQVPNPHIDFINSPVYVNDQLTEWKSEGVRRAGVTSLGLTGTNVHMLLEEAPGWKGAVQADRKEIVTLSAKNAVSLQEMVGRLRRRLEADESPALKDIAYTVNTGRSHFNHRIAVIAQNRAELVEKLRTLEGNGLTISGSVFAGVRNDSLLPAVCSPVFIFGDYHAGDPVTGADLAKTSRAFAGLYTSCIREEGGQGQTELFALQYASAKLLISLGLEPNAVLGVGLGKSVSDVMQGKTSLQSGLAIARECKPAAGSVDPARLEQVLRQMVKDGHNLFIVLESKTRLGNQVKELLAGQDGVLCAPLDQSSDLLYQSLCELYIKGVSLQWDGLYQGEERKRIHLPVYAYHRRSLLIQPHALRMRRRAAAADAGLLGPDEDSLNSLPVKPVTAEELLELFCSVTGTALDLDADFTENGADSIMVMQAAGLIKRQYQLTIPMDLFYTVTTVRELVDRLVEMINIRLTEATAEGKDGAEVPAISESNLMAAFGMGGDEAPSAAEADDEGTAVNEDRQAGQTGVLNREEQRGEPFQGAATGFHLSGRNEKLQGDRHLPVISPEEVEAMTVTAEAPEQIFFTGATGFLGAHLIRDLMVQTQAQIHCLVRGETVDQAYERVRDKFRYYFGDGLDQHMGQRIQVIKGELAEPYLGLGEDQYNDLAGRVEAIIHTAADVRHQGKYSVFERNNVFTTRQLLEFAFHRRMKIFHHASTFGVAGWNSEYRMYTENDFYTGQTFPQMPYGRSKFEAEKLVYEARKQGLQGSVYRIGNLAGRFSDGLFQPNIESNEVYGYIKSIVLLGQIPSGIRNGRYEITPVDLTSDAMTRLIRHRELTGYTYHLPYPRLITFGELVDGLNQTGHRIAEVDFQKFYQHLVKEMERQSGSVELNLLLTSLQAANDRPQQGTPVRPLSVQSQFTRNVLARVGFTWPEMDLAYLERIFKYCESVGYFPKPDEKSVKGRLARLLKR